MRVVVVGTSGAGKSTFARALAAALACPYIELDQLHWGPAWTPVPQHAFEQAVRDATEGERWVADGNYRAVRDVLWPRATRVVWLNYGRLTVFSRVLLRTLGRLLQRTTLWHGNRESWRLAFFSRKSILVWSVSTFSHNRRKFSALRQDPLYAHLRWTELRHPREASAFIAAHWRQGT